MFSVNITSKLQDFAPVILNYNKYSLFSFLIFCLDIELLPSLVTQYLEIELLLLCKLGNLGSIHRKKDIFLARIQRAIDVVGFIKGKILILKLMTKSAATKCIQFSYELFLY